MKKFFYYLPRILAIVIVGFFAMFILEGFSPEFGWQAALMHGLMASVALAATIVAWKWPKVGGWFFILFGVWYLWTAFQAGWWSGGLLVGGVPLITGVLFLVEGFWKKWV